MDGLDSENGRVPRRGQFASTSYGLIEKVKVGHAEAWRRLVRTYAPLVFYWCRRVGLDREDAADVGQEVFRSVAQAMPNFHHHRDGDTFRGWLNRITHNKIRDFRRQRHLPEPLTGGSWHQAWLTQIPEDSGTGSTGNGELTNPKALLCRQVVQRLKNDFRQQTWEAFWQTTINDRSASDVADELDMTATAVRKAKSRVLRRVRDELCNGNLLS